MVARSGHDSYLGRDWRLAPALCRLVDEINAAHPNRNKASDGSIGDLSHHQRVSDHLPNGQGVVTAVDVTHDPAHGVDAQALFDHLGADSRTKYTIHNGRILSKTRGNHAYSGANPHTHHVHVSIQDSAANDTRPWLGAPHPSAPVDLRAIAEAIKDAHNHTLRMGSRGDWVKLAQSLFNHQGSHHLSTDGIFGQATEKAVKDLQRWFHLAVDGVLGPKTWAVLVAISTKD